MTQQQQDQGWTKKGQRQEPEPSRDATGLPVCRRCGGPTIQYHDATGFAVIGMGGCNRCRIMTEATATGGIRTQTGTTPAREPSQYEQRRAEYFREANEALKADNSALNRVALSFIDADVEYCALKHRLNAALAMLGTPMRPEVRELVVDPSRSSPDALTKPEVSP